MADLCLQFDPDEEADLRRKLRLLLAGTIPATALDLVTDLTVHSVQEALAAMNRTAARAPDLRHFCAVVVPACGVLRAKCDQIENSLRQIAEREGMTPQPRSSSARRQS